jgi:GTPase SAR1 family protein
MKRGYDMSINIGLVGNSNVGKTSLIRKYARRENIKEHMKVATIGIDCE